MQITNSGDRKLSLIRALVHGDSGVGKTTSLGTLPEEHTVIVALERGLLPLRHKNYRVLQAESWQDLRDLCAAVRRAEVNSDHSINITIGGETLQNVKCIAIDSLTECNTFAKRQIVEVDRRKLIDQRTGGKTDQVTGIYDEQMTQEDWGILSTRMAEFINTVTHFPIHTIFTSLSARVENRKTGETWITADLNGKLAWSVPAHFDMVLYMRAAKDADGNDTRVWQTYNDGEVVCKDASGELPQYMTPDYTELFKRALGKPQKEAA